jgi:hypothetical protein
MITGMTQRIPSLPEGDSSLDDRAGSLLRISEQARRRSLWDSTMRPNDGEPVILGTDNAWSIPGDLLSERLDELERNVNQLEWNDRQLRRELARAQQEFRDAQKARRRWKLAAIAAFLWMLGTLALDRGNSARQAEAHTDAKVAQHARG